MEGITLEPAHIMMEKPYLSAPGIDCVGHAVFQKAGKELVTHIHQDCMEIVFVLDGEASYHVEGQNYSMVGGEAFITFVNQPHRSLETFQSVGEIYWIQLNLACTENFLGYDRDLSIEITGRLLEINRHSFRFDSTIKTLIKRIYDEFYIRGTTPMALSSLMFLVNLVLDRVGKNDLLKNRFLELKQYIEQHISEDIRVEDLSGASGFSVSTIHHRFREYFGRSPAEYINYKKIQRSKELLLDGRSVTDTAMFLGFNTSDYFSTVFKKFNGISPTQWLNKMRTS